jgi:hypothetical protein
MSNSGLMLYCLKHKPVPELIAKRIRYMGNGVYTEESEASVFLIRSEMIGYAGVAGGDGDELST